MLDLVKPRSVRGDMKWIAIEIVILGEADINHSELDMGASVSPLDDLSNWLMQISRYRHGASSN